MTKTQARKLARPDGRKFAQLKTRKFNPQKADWTQSNIALARKWKVTRQRVLAIRKQLGHPKVESRGRPRKA